MREHLIDRFDDVLYGEAETGDPPSVAFQELMQDAGFVDILRRYFENGDTVRESSPLYGNKRRTIRSWICFKNKSK